MNSMNTPAQDDGPDGSCPAPIEALSNICREVSRKAMENLSERILDLLASPGFELPRDEADLRQIVQQSGNDVAVACAKLAARYECDPDMRTWLGGTEVQDVSEAIIERFGRLFDNNRYTRVPEFPAQLMEKDLKGLLDAKRAQRQTRKIAAASRNNPE